MKYIVMISGIVMTGVFFQWVIVIPKDYFMIKKMTL